MGGVKDSYAALRSNIRVRIGRPDRADDENDRPGSSDPALLDRMADQPGSPEPTLLDRVADQPGSSRSFPGDISNRTGSPDPALLDCMSDQPGSPESTLLDSMSDQPGSPRSFLGGISHRPGSPDPALLNRMSEDCQRRISAAHDRSVSGTSQISNISALSNVSDFLEARVNLLSSEANYYRMYHGGLVELKCKRDLNKKVNEKLNEKVNEQVNEDLNQNVSENDEKSEMVITGVLEHLTMVLRELRFIERFAVTVERDIDDELEDHPNPNDEAKLKFMENAYTKTLMGRIQALSGNQEKTAFSKHDQQRFRADVVERYGGFYTARGKKELWCHVTCRAWGAESVRAAHIVPKGLGGDEIAFLFGEAEFVRKDPRNGLTLHKCVEQQMDLGNIAILPAQFPVAADSSQWKCFVVVDEMLDNIATYYGDECIRWRDLHEKPLEFLTASRPARRYLYLRFLATYMWAKKREYTRFTDAVEVHKDFWASPGPYLEKSTLLAVARTAGLELPESIMNGTTFEHRPSNTDMNSLVPGATMQLCQTFKAAQQADASSWGSSSNGGLTEDGDSTDEE